MPAFSRLLSRIIRRRSHASDQYSTDSPPTVAWLLAHRQERHGKSALTGTSPTASLYRMYEYLGTGFIIGLRSEMEHFYNQPSWAVSAIPDPKDQDPQRYAILAVLPYYLVVAFNRLIERGLPRGSPAMIISDEMEEELRSRDKILEEEPGWVKQVPKLAETLVIPGGSGEEPSEESRGERLLAMNIVAEEPHVLFV